MGTCAANIARLEGIARKIRCRIIEMTANAGSGHPGGSLSATDIMVALYFYELKHRPQDPRWPERDRFVLSKGHAAPALYAVLAEAGYFDESELMNLRRPDSNLQGHPKNIVPGVEVTTGSLGQGLSFGLGMALASELSGLKHRTFVLLSDGETEEGQVWEAAMAAAHYRRQGRLGPLYAIVDFNGFQLDGRVEEIMNVNPYRNKWEAFGWKVCEIDGHSFKELVEALQLTRGEDYPTCIIAHTTKGKGVSFMENNNRYHGKAPTPDEAEKALAELDCKQEWRICKG